MLLDTIKSDLVTAQKNREQERVDTLRFLLGALRNARIEKYPQGDDASLTDDDVASVIAKQVKTHKESIDMFAQGGRKDLVDREQAQLAILQSYLPEQMDEQGVRDQVLGIRKANPEADFGTMMKLSMSELKGKADGSLVSKILREMIESK